MLCVMPYGDKSQVRKAREMTLNIRHGNGAAIVVRVRESRIHGEGRQVILLIIEWRYAKCKKLKRYYQY